MGRLGLLLLREVSAPSYAASCKQSAFEDAVVEFLQRVTLTKVQVGAISIYMIGTIPTQHHHCGSYHSRIVEVSVMFSLVMSKGSLYEVIGAMERIVFVEAQWTVWPSLATT